MTFLTFEEAVLWIENSHRFGDKLDLKRMEIACEMLGHPEKSFRSIHVAGTNGKGSTANYLKNILHEAGYKVGIYTSPYVVKFNERIGIDMDYISDDDVVVYANQLKELWDEVYQTHQEAITFFEILTLMCFIYFRDKAVEFGVIEVGLGGLLDATNVIIPEVSVITNISFDHMKQLGNTLDSIAYNKLGIVKHGVPLVTSVEQEELKPQFIQTCEQRNAEIYFSDITKVTDISLGETTKFRYLGQRYELMLPGLHQIKNAVLSIDAIEVFADRLGIVISHKAIFDGLRKTTWPGRLEIFHHNIILDGAHNIGGITTLRDAMSALYPNKKIKCLFCMMKDKDHYHSIHVLDDIVSEFCFTEIDYPRRADAEELFNESTHPLKRIEKDFRKAFSEMSQLKDDEVLLITGSLYFISEARKLLVQE